MQLLTQTKAVSAPSSKPVQSGLLQRKCACGGSAGLDGECEECREKKLQRRPPNGVEPTAVPSIVHEVLRSSGQPLDAATRAFMEPRFGHDFSNVRIHTGGKAAESARAVNALAYTVGQNLVFGARQYSPETSAGRRLMAHELTHVIQQRGTQVGGVPAISVSGQNDSFEKNAERIAQQVVGQQISSSGLDIPGAPVSLQRTGELYNITLRPGFAIENAPLDRAQRFLRSQLLARLRGSAEAKREQHQDLISLREESFVNEYLVAPVSETLGGVDMPPLNIWEATFRFINAIEEEIDAGQINQALQTAQTAEEAYARAAQRVQNYLDGVTTGGDRAVTGLEFIRNASVVVVGTAATVATGGLVAGAAIGTGYGTALTITQQATEVNLGLRQEIDWEHIAFDALLNFVLSVAGGRIGGSIAGRILGNPAAAGLGRQAVARIVSNVIVGRGTALVSVAAQSLYAIVRGQRITPEQFADRLAEQLSVQGAFMDIVYGEIAHHAVGAATRPGTSDNVRSLEAARSRQQVRTTQQRTTTTRPQQRSGTRGASSPRVRGSNLALAEPQTVPDVPEPVQPLVEPNVPEPVVESEPAQLPIASRPSKSAQATGVGLGATTSLRTRLAPDVLQEPETDEHGCRYEPIAMQFGRYPCHGDFAASLSGDRREFRVTTPEGDSVDFDAMDHGRNLYEVKTGYGFLLNQHPSLQDRIRKTRERFINQSADQMIVAERCGRPLRWYFNNEAVARDFESRIEPPVVYQAFNCDVDSDG